MEYPGEKLLTRMWETLAEKGVGALLRPWQIRREGKAHTDVRAHEIIALAQAARTKEDIDWGRKVLIGGSLVELAKPADQQPVAVQREGNAPLLKDLGSIAAADLLRREINVAKALLHAESELEADTQEPPTQFVDDDWLYRWRDYAGSISLEDLQRLWGTMLAGEIKSPGSFSLRTLDFLRNLSQSEAKDIEKLAPFVVNQMIFTVDEELFEQHGLVPILLRMQALGIVYGVGSFGHLMFKLKTDLPESTVMFVATLFLHDRRIIVHHEDPTKVLALPTYPLTEIGKQILRLGKFQPNEEYLRKVSDAIKEQGFKVALDSYAPINEKQVFNLERI